MLEPLRPKRRDLLRKHSDGSATSSPELLCDRHDQDVNLCTSRGLVKVAPRLPNQMVAFAIGTRKRGLVLDEVGAPLAVV
jgi:hypothetical protein